MRTVCRRLEGAFTLVATAATEPDTLVAARRSSPLVVGVGKATELSTSWAPTSPRSSRTPARRASSARTRSSRSTGPAALTVTDFAGGAVEPKAYTVDWDAAAAEKGGYDWFMLKEIAEQPQAVADTLLGRLGAQGELVLDEVRLSDQELRDIDKIFVVACGTAYHAGLIAKYAIEHWTRIPVEVELASEFRYRDPVLDRSTLVVVISQSGETMDTLMALRHAKEQKARVLAICNANGSTIPRESDAVLYTHAGPEVAVASTKGFLTQVVACYLVGLFLAQVRGVKYEDEVAAIVADLRRLPEAVAEVLAGHGAGAGAGAVPGRREHDPLPRPARRVPGGARGGAEAQGARLHPRRGVRRRGAQARLDRGHRPGHAGRRRRPVAAQPGVAARQGRLQHPGGPRPRRPHDRDRGGGRRGRRPVRRPPDPRPADADAAGAGGHHRAAAGASPARSPTPGVWTSTSRATSRRASPSSERTTARVQRRRRPPGRLAR